jgi:hypothetical protein
MLLDIMLHSLRTLLKPAHFEVIKYFLNTSQKIAYKDYAEASTSHKVQVLLKNVYEVKILI